MLITQSLPSIRIAIITPTYRRIAFLKPFIRQVLRQEYENWTLVIVNDGEDREARQVVEGFSQNDARIHFFNTIKTNNDSGNTPRLLALKFLARFALSDYIVFWDDDNSFYPGALSSIVRSLQEANLPEVLLVPIKYLNYTLPRPVPVAHLQLGQVDAANLVVRTLLAARIYEHLMINMVKKPVPDHVAMRDAIYSLDDYGLLKAIRQKGDSRICVAECLPIGRYDGLRPLESVYSMLCWPLLNAIRYNGRFSNLALDRFKWYRHLRWRLDPFR